MADSDAHFTTYIHSAADDVWRRVTEPEAQRDWYMPASDWNLVDGGRISWGAPGDPAIVGDVVSVRPGQRYLAHTFAFVFLDEPPGLVRWRVTQMGEVTQVWLRHELEDRPATGGIVRGSWNVMLARLKSLVEAGRPMPEPVWPAEGWDVDPA